MMDKSLLLKLELFDGTSQVVQITEEQAARLGINIAENGPGFVVPVTNDGQSMGMVQESSVVPADAGTKENEITANYMYKIIKPEDLDLRPNTATHGPRGRPRKRPIEQVTPEQSKSVKEPHVVIKQVRTRSGRITKPPRYIGQDFRIINTAEDVEHDDELRTVEYDTLKAGEATRHHPAEPHLHLEQHSRKRNIPSHYRCPTCKKAYLGKMKMVNHFNKYPDHGPPPNFCKAEHNSTWNYLVLATQKSKEGTKGVKFCQELTVLLENARSLAKFLFKPVGDGECGYFIDECLAHVFGIVSGDYVMNENELQKDAALHVFLKKCKEEKKPARNAVRSEETKLVTAEEERTHRNNSELRMSEMHNSDRDVGAIKVNDVNNRTSMVESAQSVVNFSSHPGSSSDVPPNENNCDQTFLPNGNSLATTEKEHFLLDGHDDVIGFENLNNLESVLGSAQRLNNDSVNYHTLNASLRDKEQQRDVPTNNNGDYDIDKHNIMMGNDLLSQVMLENVTAGVNQNHSPLRCVSEKKCDNYPANKHPLDNELLSHVDELMLENVGERKLSAQIENPKKPDVKKNNDYELLSHVEDLILENIDTGQVSNMLETSSNSDDIMNVDQFVNERFKKLTEPDLELQNASLNLDLPPLDMFHFHTS